VAADVAALGDEVLGLLVARVAVGVVVQVLAELRLESDSSMRSCGRFGPAMEGTTVERSSSMYSEKVGQAVLLSFADLQVTYLLPEKNQPADS
jgi:hypothetical protein